MPAFEFKLPDIGEGVHEGEIVAWHVEVGQAVNADDPVVDVMTDKVTVTIGAPRKGRITSLGAAVGVKVQVGETLVVFELSEGDIPESLRPKTQPGTVASAVGDIRESLPGSSFFSSPSTERESASHASAFFQDKPLATPATRKLARELGVDLKRVPPSGPGGRVTREDITQGLRGSSTRPSVHPTPAAALTEDKRIPFVGMRRKIAEKLRHSKDQAVHYTFVEECDVSELVGLRDNLKEAALEEGVKLTYLPWIVRAVCLSLKKHPLLNSSLDTQTNELVLRKSCHIGVATSTPQGLMVPVLRDADQRGLLSTAKEIARLAEGARKGSLTANEASGSTFTITSLGQRGGLFATPVINFPEVAVLGVHQIKQKPVVRHGQIVVGNVMLLSLTLDHRIVDGDVGSSFAYDVIRYLESPALLYLDWS